MKLPLESVEERAAYMKLISNQTTETNITINWTGGGQINECKHSPLAKLHKLAKLTPGPGVDFSEY